jgi:SAM-dependent methyltransferase
MTEFNGVYADYYDSFHDKKNYYAEINNLLEILKNNYGLMELSEVSILDFGCGTGKHMSVLHELGLKVSGYDLSEDMLKIARRNNAKDLVFFNKLSGELNFDMVLSLFDVASYQYTDQKFDKYLEQMDSVLDKNGVLVFDGWHANGVTHSPPENRSRIIKFEDVEISREVAAKHFSDSGITELTIQIIDKKTDKTILTEIHKLRSFTLDYISAHLKKLNYQKIDFYDGVNLKSRVNNTSWRFLVVASKIN